MLAEIRQAAECREMSADPVGSRSAHRSRKPRLKWQKWYLLWWLAIMLALLVMGGGNGLV